MHVMLPQTLVKGQLDTPFPNQGVFFLSSRVYLLAYYRTFQKVVDAVWTPNSEALPYMAYVACPALKPLGTAFVVLQFPISSSSSESQEAREKHFTEAVPVRRSPVKSASDDDTTFEVSTGSANNAVGDGSGSLTLTFSNATGLLVHAAFNSSNEGSADVSIDLAQQWGYYTAYQSGLEGLDLGTTNNNISHLFPSSSSSSSLFLLIV